MSRSNVSIYNNSIELIAREDRATFESYFIGYVASSVPESAWVEAIERARQYVSSDASLKVS